MGFWVFGLGLSGVVGWAILSSLGGVCCGCLLVAMGVVCSGGRVAVCVSCLGARGVEAVGGAECCGCGGLRYAFSGIDCVACRFCVEVCVVVSVRSCFM